MSTYVIFMTNIRFRKDDEIENGIIFIVTKSDKQSSIFFFKDIPL